MTCDARLRLILFLAAVLLVVPDPSLAIDWESLISPGLVIAGHAKAEKNCKGCHVPFSRDEQRRLCLDCHREIADDIAARRGHHFRSEPARVGQCRSCHTDHEGRDADIVRLVPQAFDHSLTEFILDGGHSGAACADCHEPGAKHREAPTACIGCHADDDPHRKALGEDCASCHGVTDWKKPKFDHLRATDGRYPLTGGHASVGCGLCHAGQRYQETPTACVACHRIDDVHAGERGPACRDCHDTGSWKKTSFDHLRKTGFALTAGHAGLACGACHQGSDFSKLAGSDCLACHRSDDTHQGRNGGDCKSCHTTQSWRDTRFDHAQATRFPLRGGHAALTCIACHKGAAPAAKLETTCVSCHGAEDPHKGVLGADCAGCHREEGWTSSVRFDHDLTGFPLAGLHGAAACESCHLDKRFAGTPANCVDCHRADDAHRGALGLQCAQCHNPNDWRLWTFDHAVGGGFALDGKHAGLQCVACHRQPPGEKRGKTRDCASCHRADDVHSGQFGVDCARCHGTNTFSRARRTMQ